jgi:hypothetical protein
MSIHKTDGSDKQISNEVSFEVVDKRAGVHTAVLLVLLFIFSGFSAFALGRLSVGDGENERSVVVETVAPLFEEEIREVRAPHNQVGSAGARGQEEAPFLVGSRHSDKYHFPWCPGAQRIKPENLVTFSSYEEARRAGYTPARNYPGLE